MFLAQTGGISSSNTEQDRARGYSRGQNGRAMPLNGRKDKVEESKRSSGGTTT